MIAEIPFGEWLPDAPSFKNPGCEEADNVVPITGGYGPFPALVASGQTVTGAVRGAQRLYDNAGSSVIVGGTDTRLFIRRSTITQTTGMTSIGASEAWDFAQFNDFVFATAANNNPQYLTDIDSDSTWSALTGSPPVAKRCARVGDFLMLGNTATGVNFIEWSAFNNPAGAWAASRLTQAGSAGLPTEYGAVQRIMGGRYATVFQQRGISRLTYVGPPVVWRADPVSKDRGAVAPFAVVSIGYLSYFLSQDGFFVTNGSSVEPIGTQRVNSWFFANVAQSMIAEVHGTVDWQRECIVWAFTSKVGATYDRVIIYSFSQNRWSTGTCAPGWLVGSTLSGTDLEGLDAIYGNLDAVPLSLDSAEFAPSSGILAAFVMGTSTADYSTFAGAPLAATWETGEFQPSPGQRVFVSEVTPLMQTDEWDASAVLFMRDQRGVRTASAAATAGWSGFAPVRGEGNKVAVRLTKPAGTAWSEAQGVQVNYRPAGQR